MIVGKEKTDRQITKSGSIPAGRCILLSYLRSHFSYRGSII